MSLVDVARENGGRIIVPSGAILGLDAVRAVSLGKVYSVTMITRKPPNGLKKAPFVIDKGIKLEKLDKELSPGVGPSIMAYMATKKDDIIELFNKVKVIRDNESVEGDYAKINTLTESYKVTSKNKKKVKILLNESTE